MVQLILTEVFRDIDDALIFREQLYRDYGKQNVQFFITPDNDNVRCFAICTTYNDQFEPVVIDEG